MNIDEFILKFKEEAEKNEIIITDDNILLRIEAVDKNRIEKVYIKLPKPAEEEN